MNYRYVLSIIALGGALSGCSKTESSGSRSSPAGSDVISQSIHGSDDRVETRFSSEALQKAAESIPALVPSSRLRKLTTGQYVRTDNHTVFSQYGVCQDQPFSNEPYMANCSATLIGPDTLLTAGHCVQGTQRSDSLKNVACPGLLAVFGFIRQADGTVPSEFAANDVYECSEILFSHYEASGFSRRDDFAIIKLKRAVIGRTPLKLRADGNPRSGDSIAMIGYPESAPQKITVTENAFIAHNDPSVILANLDVFPGNSGSALINPVTLEVQGVVTGQNMPSGQTDYIYDYANACNRRRVVTEGDYNYLTQIQRIEKVRAALNLPLRPAIQKQYDVLGQVESLATDTSGNIFVTGFACQKDYARAYVQVFVNGPKGPGRPVVQLAIPSINSEPEINQACGTAGGQYRFSVKLNPMVAPGEKIYVQGYSFEGGVNSLLRFGEGVVVPAPGTSLSFPLTAAVDDFSVQALAAIPADVVNTGESMMLSVPATGDRLTFQWYKKAPTATRATLVSESTNRIGTLTSTLLLKNLRPVETGTSYYVVVTDSAGYTVKTNSVSITVRGPQILKAPLAQTIAAGGSASFTVVVYGDGNTFQWERIVGRLWVPVQESAQISGVASSQLQFTSATKDLTGTYRVRVSRDGISITGGKVTLTVLD